MKSYTAFNLAAMASTVAAHGYLKSPAPRMPGEAMKAACGQQVYTTFSSDINGNMQGALQNPGEGFDNSKCNIWTCKGMQFEDNKDNVQSWTAGQKVPIEVNIAAPHTGVANLTIIDTATSSPIGEPLISWTEYASTARGVQANETSFDITIPSDLGSKCAEAGACTLQWWWDARDIDQTYEACIDFTVGGSGAAPAPSASASAPASSAAAPSAPASSAAAPSAPASSAAAPSAPATSAAAPAPSSEAPAPSSAAPAPSSAAPAPSSAAPAPSSAAPAPSSAAPAPSSAAPAPTTIQTSFKPVPTGGAVTDAAAKYARCGGQGYEGPTVCADNWVCKEWNTYYSQCVESA